jgi:hypothetical protein
MSEEIVYQVLLQRMDEIQTVKLERVLGRIDEFAKVADIQRQMEQTIINIDLRLEMVEAEQRKPTTCEEKMHEKRIERMERTYSRFIAAGLAAIIVINIMFFIAKEVL